MMTTKTTFLVIYHKAFQDGTPRTVLFELRLEGRLDELAQEIIDTFNGCESDESWDFYELRARSEEHGRLFGELLQGAGVVPSMYCEFYLKRPNT